MGILFVININKLDMSLSFLGQFFTKGKFYYGKYF